MKHFSTDFLTTFQTLPNSCVYALISDSTKECLVCHSNNLQSSLGRLLCSNKIKEKDVRLVILDILDDLEYKLLLAEKRKLEYISLGYKIINSRNYINYKVSIQYSKMFDSIFVVLYNKRRDKKIVGIFERMNEAKEFVSTYYKQQEFIFPVYSTNKCTREYMEKEKRVSKNSRIQS